jgi:hypothetical protein
VKHFLRYCRGPLRPHIDGQLEEQLEANLIRSPLLFPNFRRYVLSTRRHRDLYRLYIRSYLRFSDWLACVAAYAARG